MVKEKNFTSDLNHFLQIHLDKTPTTTPKNEYQVTSKKRSLIIDIEWRQVTSDEVSPEIAS